MTSYTKTAGQKANYINHVALVLDASSSMSGHSGDVIKVADTQIQHLAKQSQIMDQETRVSVYTFSYHNSIECLVYDKDVLRLPSIAGLYRAYGQTALCGATTLAIKDLQHTWEGYGEHAFLIYVITDGFENDSLHADIKALPGLIQGLPDHWTLAAFVPDARSKHFTKGLGFGNDNIAIWNADATNGFIEVGEVIRQATDNYMQARTSGVRGSKSIFNLKPVAAQDIKANLTPLTKGSYTLNQVPQDGRIDEFYQAVTSHAYAPGKAFYQLTKLEEVQGHKQVAIRLDKTGEVYMGDHARQLLGLPDGMTTKVKPGDHKDYTIFVQSTAFNRKLLGGTECLILR